MAGTSEVALHKIENTNSLFHIRFFSINSGGHVLLKPAIIPAKLHAKVFVFDRRALFVGSLNLDPRSAMLNTEIGLVFASPELASQAVTEVSKMVAGCT